MSDRWRWKNVTESLPKRLQIVPFITTEQAKTYFDSLSDVTIQDDTATEMHFGHKVDDVHNMCCGGWWCDICQEFVPDVAWWFNLPLIFTCDHCDKRAINFARDTIEVPSHPTPDNIEQYNTFHIGPIKHGCSDHPAYLRQLQLDLM